MNKKCFMLLSLLLMPIIGLPTISLSEASQSGLIKVALTANVAPRADWSNGTLYHLRIVEKFVPIQVDVITAFSSLQDYDFLFLNKLNISEADVETVSSWVDGGGVLVVIGQSGRYDELGHERSTHPFSLELGISLNSWERTVGSGLRYLRYLTSWRWWNKQSFYDVGWESPTYPPSKENIVNVSISQAEPLAIFTDVENGYPTTAISRKPFGNGMAYLIASDIFWEVGQHQRFPSYNIFYGGVFCRIISCGALPYLHLNFLAIIMDNMEHLVIVGTLPYDLRVAAGFRLHTEGTLTSWVGRQPDEEDDACFEALTTRWKPEVFDVYPSLKGWFWQFPIPTAIIDGTSNASNIVSFVNEYGLPHSHTHNHVNTVENLTRSFQVLNELFPNGQFTYDGAGWSPGYITVEEFYEIWTQNNGTGMAVIQNQRRENQRYPSYPLPIWTVDDPTIKLWLEGGSGPGTWLEDVQAIKEKFGEYGLGGYSIDYRHDLEGTSPVTAAMPLLLEDDQVWLTNDKLFMEWWKDRWSVNITDCEVTASRIVMTLETPEISGLTFVLPDGNRTVIPYLNAGVHTIVLVGDEIVEQNYTLTVGAAEGGTTFPPPNIYEYPENTLVQVSGIPDDNHTFSHWILNSDIHPENPITVLMDTNHTLTPQFNEKTDPTEQEEILLSLQSNSTVTDFLFLSKYGIIDFTVSGENGTTGYFKLNISKTILSSPAQLTVYLDGDKIHYTDTDCITFISILCTYQHSSHTVRVSYLKSAPDSLSIVAPFLLLLLLLSVSITIYFRIRRQTKKEETRTGPIYIQSSISYHLSQRQ